MKPSKTETLPINGVLLVNKPYGKTSNAILQQVKHLYKAKKAGHTGSLDPMATGMLPICFGEATKFSQFLLDADKAYEATGVLGIKTNTGDAMGEIVAQKNDFSIAEQDLVGVLKEFTGSILQVPSMFSALKHRGTPLYEYARKGIEINREARKIHIHELSLQKYQGVEFDVIVRCSKGTYIRNLIEDVGERLHVGAHVSRLFRIYTAGFEKEPMYTIEELLNKSHNALLSLLLPIDRAVSHLPEVCIEEEELVSLRQGIPINLRTSLGEGLFRMYHKETHLFAGLGEIDTDGKLTSRRLLAFT